MIEWIKLLPVVALLTGPALTDARSGERQKMAEAIERRVSNAQFTGAVLVSRGQKIVLNEGMEAPIENGRLRTRQIPASAWRR